MGHKRRPRGGGEAEILLGLPVTGKENWKGQRTGDIHGETGGGAQAAMLTKEWKGFEGEGTPGLRLVQTVLREKLRR